MMSKDIEKNFHAKEKKCTASWLSFFYGIFGDFFFLSSFSLRKSRRHENNRPQSKTIVFVRYFNCDERMKRGVYLYRDRCWHDAHFFSVMVVMWCFMLRRSYKGFSVSLFLYLVDELNFCFDFLIQLISMDNTKYAQIIKCVHVIKYTLRTKWPYEHRLWLIFVPVMHNPTGKQKQENNRLNIHCVQWLRRN